MRYGRYEIIKELGKGGMGVVYQAHDPQIDRPVALKVLREDRVVSKDFVSRFFKEAKFIGRLSHPNIVTVYDVGRDHGTIYIAMEYLQGQPFNEVIRSGKLSVEKIVDIALQVANALGYAHEKGIVHRDIKPSNIILTDEGNVKLTDFGIARAEDSNAAQQTQAGVILGTPFYMSPEQVMGKRVDGRSDLFSLGVILYELIVGRKPFEGDHFTAIFRAITDDIPVAPLKIDDSIPQSLSDLIMKALSKNPNKRFQTSKEMGYALKTCLQAKESLLLPGKPISPKKKPVVSFLIMGLMAAVILGGTIYFFGAYNNKKQASSLSTRIEGNKPVDAILMVTSSPSGAQVFLDDSFKGNTPINLEIPIGKYEVRVSLPDYLGWEAQLQISEPGETPLHVRLISIE
ncbi:MAG: serine/threonine protein kinase [Deltaproteobacteria bacterium]|nr:serine/threonine protein kinase [Deltaproteobacteria bacterium]MBW2165329.1 serine/threonine protein kinase [Deltaproteobacteria bacterium]